MGPSRQVPLAPYTTLGLGGPAAAFIEPGTEADLAAAVRAADERGEPLLVLGGGSNVVIADTGFPGLVVRVATRGLSAGPDPGGPDGAVRLTVAAGESWDDVVAHCVAENLAGLECLSGIPGLAAPPRSRTSAPTARKWRARSSRSGPGTATAPPSPRFPPRTAASATGPAASSTTAATWCWP